MQQIDEQCTNFEAKFNVVRHWSAFIPWQRCTWYKVHNRNELIFVSFKVHFARQQRRTQTMLIYGAAENVYVPMRWDTWRTRKKYIFWLTFGRDGSLSHVIQKHSVSNQHMQRPYRQHDTLENENTKKAEFRLINCKIVGFFLFLWNNMNWGQFVVSIEFHAIRSIKTND